MKTEFLKELGIEQEVIDKIMAENGKDIEKYKTDAETLKATTEQQKTQLIEANKQIEGFKGMDIEGIKAAAEKYKTDFEKAQADHQAELNKIKYNSNAEKFIDSLKPKDSLSRNAILSEFAKKEFKLDGDTFQGANEWAETFKKDNASHFLAGDGKVTTVSTGGDHGDPLDGDTDKFLAAAMQGAGLSTETK